MTQILKKKRSQAILTAIIGLGIFGFCQISQATVFYDIEQPDQDSNSLWNYHVQNFGPGIEYISGIDYRDYYLLGGLRHVYLCEGGVASGAQASSSIESCVQQENYIASTTWYTVNETFQHVEFDHTYTLDTTETYHIVITGKNNPHYPNTITLLSYTGSDKYPDYNHCHLDVGPPWTWTCANYDYAFKTFWDDEMDYDAESTFASSIWFDFPYDGSIVNLQNWYQWDIHAILDADEIQDYAGFWLFYNEGGPTVKIWQEIATTTVEQQWKINLYTDLEVGDILAELYLYTIADLGECDPDDLMPEPGCTFIWTGYDIINFTATSTATTTYWNDPRKPVGSWTTGSSTIDLMIKNDKSIFGDLIEFLRWFFPFNLIFYIYNVIEVSHEAYDNIGTFDISLDDLIGDYVPFSVSEENLFPDMTGTVWKDNIYPKIELVIWLLGFVWLLITFKFLEYHKSKEK